MIIQIVFLFILIGINAFFAASEIAIISLNDNKIKKMAEEGHKKAKLLEKLISEPSRFLATIQVGITLAGLLASAFAAESFADRITSTVRNTGLPVDDSIIKTVTVVLITIILAYFQLVLGELVPKRLAMQKPEAISMFVIKPISLLSSVTEPFVKLLTHSTNFVIRIFGGNPYADEEKITEEEIRMMVDVGQEKGVIQGTEKEMINNIFEFDNTSVSEIMTHRTDIFAIPIDADLEYIMEFIRTEKYTRIPVYEETIDNIVGVMHIKDMFNYVSDNTAKNFKLKDVLRTPYFVPQSKKTDELFKELQKNKNHMAIVIDEYGGTAGIVTIEDLLEEIVGNIFDEYDEEEKEIEKLDENTYVIDGLVSLEKVKNLLDVDLPVDEYETLSGFMMGQLGRIPKEEEKPELEFNGIVFKVEEVDEKRIARVKTCRAY
ncbi:MAG: hemolysin family protein [Clostridia bacterium]|nr:hemolysin family protein [Clostridia bacterium]